MLPWQSIAMFELHKKGIATMSPFLDPLSIQSFIQSYTLPTLHPDLQPYLQGDELQHPLVSVDGGVYPRNYGRINQLYAYKQQQSRQSRLPNRWQSYYPDLPPFERISKFQMEETEKSEFPRQDPDFYQLLGQIWTDPEMLGPSSSFLEFILGIMFGMPLSQHVYHLMTPSEQQKLASMSPTFQVFRGHDNRFLGGISWTLSLDVALLYSVGCPDQASVSVGTVNRSEVIAFIDRRQEDEVIVPSRSVSNIETYSVCHIQTQNNLIH